jgi:hypothetical protein
MQPIVGLMLAKDIQRRAHADAALHRRSLAATPEDITTQGKRWILRIWPGLPRRRRSADRVGA